MNRLAASMPMRPAATATATAGLRQAGGCHAGSAGGHGRREDGEFFGKLRRAALRTFRPAPVAGTHQDFAVLVALPAMKFVDRHGLKLTGPPPKLKRHAGHRLEPSGPAAVFCSSRTCLRETAPGHRSGSRPPVRPLLGRPRAPPAAPNGSRRCISSRSRGGRTRDRDQSEPG